MKRMRVTVVKVGGSLLTAPQFPERLRAWLDAAVSTQPDAHFVLIAGGGQWVDAVRRLDARAPLGEERAHWLCVDIMDITARLVAAMRPELHLVAEFDKLRLRVEAPGVTILRPSEFVAHLEPSVAGTRLPADWSVTSDSIAARLAIALWANELVLLKSVPPPSVPVEANLAALASAGYVDAFLPALERELPAIRAERLPELGHRA